jgi:hypothetical protein
MTDENNNRKPSAWKVVHGFVGDGNLAIVISKTEDARPRFSMKIGKQSAEGHMMPFIPMFADGLKVRSALPTLTDLITQAEAWISEQIGESRIAFDLEQARKGKPETRRTGKTERNRNKHKQPTE